MKIFVAALAVGVALATPAVAEQVTFAHVNECSAKLAEMVVRQPQYAAAQLWKHGWETFDDVPKDRQQSMLKSMTEAMRSNLSNHATRINFDEDFSGLSYKTYGVDDLQFFRDCAGLQPEQPVTLSALDLSKHEEQIRVAISSCWNVGSLSTDALGTTVEVTFSMTIDAKPISASIRMKESSGGSEAAARQAFEAARRAIIRCGARGLGLPKGSFQDWQEMTLVFSPERLRVILKPPK